MANPRTDPAGSLFTKSDHTTLRNHRRKLNDLVGTMDKARACGINCDFIEQQRSTTDQQLANIEQYFMTPVPGK